ncbi:(S)-benzoin forming benzil reductase [Ornithinibacillus halophilus]|uniref:Benzil reductase ((S)-benzoin forming) n=1 Tax=Ornithinibacillus halophilus TaxID=930117 RepID=A0A1M5HYE3_9BACI|nr:(S)-benzoin forming benzil reductase [Ornithinibacillus halophilus]SHG20889.1 benzil reductase ((S)-benzoin forming) [Ornithinibacillus halophilus]
MYVPLIINNNCIELLYRGVAGMKIAIVTGVSKGLGKSIAELFMESGIDVIGISRSETKYLEEHAQKHQVTYYHHKCDLADLLSIEEVLAQVVEQIKEPEISTIYLVNNAATLDPIEQANNIKSQELAKHVQINTVAPMVILNRLLHEISETDANLFAVNITSGAGERPIYGWSAYCSTKASINMYTKTVALEQGKQTTGNKVIAFNPGVMDTNMQEKIRASSPDAFIDVEKFKAYKENNELKTSHEVAQVVVDIMTDDINMENGKIYSIKDYV